MPPKNFRNIYIGGKYDLNDVIKTPHLVLHMMSIRLCNRREEEMEKMIGKKMHYFENDGSLQNGIVLKFESGKDVFIKKQCGATEKIQLAQLVFL